MTNLFRLGLLHQVKVKLDPFAFSRLSGRIGDQHEHWISCYFEVQVFARATGSALRLRRRLLVSGVAGHDVSALYFEPARTTGLLGGPAATFPEGGADAADGGVVKVGVPSFGRLQEQANWCQNHIVVITITTDPHPEHLVQ